MRRPSSLPSPCRSLRDGLFRTHSSGRETEEGRCTSIRRGPNLTVGAEVPCWLEAFCHAVVRVATYVEGAGSSPRLVFATVDLLAPGRPPPVSGPLQSKRFGSAGGRVFFRRVAMEAAAATAWYAYAARGHLVTPDPLDPADRHPRRDGIPVAAGVLVAEPPWPDFVLPLDGDPLLDPAWPGAPAPFVGSGASPARISRLLAAPNEALATICRDAAVVAFLQARLHLDLSRYPEYRGGMALLVPDPISREVRLSVRPPPSPGGAHEDVLLRIMPREGADLSGLEATLIEVRGGALHRYERIAVPGDGIVVWPRPHEAAMVGYVLTHRTQGVLRHQSPAAFVRRVTMRASVASRRVSIHAQAGDSPTARDETYDVTEHADDRRIEVGQEARADDGLSRIYVAEERRRRLATAERQGQRWLDDADDARVQIRRILENASRRVWVADPYLGGGQIFQFIHAVSRLAVEIRLITSRLAFEGPRGASDGHAAEGGDKIAAFAHGMRSLDQRGFADVEAWVLRGKVPPLHDRFLVVDDDVWFSGNSLNALGSRAGLIVKVPDPDAIIGRLAALRASAVSFEGFLEGHARSERGRRRVPPENGGTDS